MCSCSGSCNCNSTTIPKGPQGNPGTNGTNGTNGGIGPQGPIGFTGAVGPNGKNAFTTLTDDFVQPAINGNIDIPVVDSTWVAIGSIIFIESNDLVGAGGYYRVINVNSLISVLVKNLGWTIPGVSIVPPGYAAGGNGTLVVAAGTIGATGNAGADGISIIDTKWGIYSGIGGSADLKTSILVPSTGGYMPEDGDTLDVQTVLTINTTTTQSFGFYIAISPVDSSATTSLAATYLDGAIVVEAGDYRTLHVNTKITRISSTTFRAKAEWFLSSGTVADYNILSSNHTITASSTTVADITLSSSSTWSGNQYIQVIVNDKVSPVVSVIHHEVRTVKKIS